MANSVNWNPVNVQKVIDKIFYALSYSEAKFNEVIGASNINDLSMVRCEKNPGSIPQASCQGVKDVVNQRSR